LYQLQKLQEAGYRDIEIVNNTDTAVNLTNPLTNQTIATVPAKTVEMTYSTNFAPSEARNGYLISTATNATAPNPGMTKGYTIFYEGSSVSAAEPTIGFGSLRPLPPVVGQILDSFQLIAAPEVAQVLVQQAIEAAEPAEGVEDDGDDDTEDNGDDNGTDTTCHPSYPDECIPPPPPNLNCDDVDATNFEVVGSDPHGFDGDNDGIGCEDGNGDTDNGDEEPEPEPEPGDGNGDGNGD
jgi:hypothetical protein